MIYVTGDIHGSIDIGKLNTRRFKVQRRLSKDDALIICGDFGLVWDNNNEEQYWRRWLDSKNFTTLFCDGNHENFHLLNQYPIEYWNGGKIHRIQPTGIHLMRGQIFNLNGCSFFVMGGASSYDREYRTEGRNWWKEELPTDREYDEAVATLKIHGWNVDYVITHTLPSKYQKEIDRFPLSPMEQFLDFIDDRLEFRHWYCGHIHEDMDLDDRHTILYNNIV